MKMRSQGSLTACRTPGQHRGFDAEMYVPASTMVCALRPTVLVRVLFMKELFILINGGV